VHEQLSEFVEAVRDVPELRSVLRNPQLESWAKGVVVSDMVGDADELVRNFLLVTADKGRIGEIEEIGKEFERLMAREQRRLRVELTTARELSDAEANEILSQIEKASGRSVEATRTVDPDLIGGIVLRAGSLQVDASVRGRLERLRHELVRS
jgi:F-type H+-transporting ATPase subunit delta